MGSGFSRGWSFSYLCPFHTRHHRGSQGRLQASRPARVHSFLCPPKALHLVAMATCCQEQAASLHEPQHPFVVRSIPLWSTASLRGPQHPVMVCSIPSWVTASLHGLLPHLCQGYGAGDAGQGSTLNLSRGMGLFSLGRPLPTFEFAAVTNSPVPTVHILSQKNKKSSIEMCILG